MPRASASGGEHARVAGRYRFPAFACAATAAREKTGMMRSTSEYTPCSRHVAIHAMFFTSCSFSFVYLRARRRGRA